MKNMKQQIQIISCIAAFLILFSGCGKQLASEADFGGGCKANKYIHGGDCTTAENEQISFYEYDLRRYDNHKETLFEYPSTVDETRRVSLEECLQGLADETAFSHENAVNKKEAEDMQAFLSRVEEQRDNHIALSNETSYKIAYACNECITQNAVIRSESVDYNTARDKYMADKAKAIMEMEPYERIMISGHNGHIQKNPRMLFTHAVEKYLTKSTEQNTIR